MRARDSEREGEPGGVARTDSMVYLTTGHVMGRSSELPLRLDNFFRTSESETRSRDSHACVPPCALSGIRSRSLIVSCSECVGSSIVRLSLTPNVVNGVTYVCLCCCLSVCLSVCCSVCNVADLIGAPVGNATAPAMSVVPYGYHHVSVHN